jgi:FeS assembly SUF system regulator
MADYAVVTMAAAARHCGGVRVNAAQLADETGLPAPTVQKLVSRLTAAGLLRSSRGVGGGLKLARPAAAITLADIVEAIEGPIALTACCEQGRHDCNIEQACTVRPHWEIVSQTMRGALANISLVQLSSPFVSSPSSARRAGARDELPPLAEVETPARGFSTSLEANGVGV